MVKSSMGRRAQARVLPGSVPARENVFTEDPLAQVRGKEILADVPDGAGIIGAGAACYQRKGGEDFGERRMFFVKAQVELLQVADAGADVGHFVDGDGFAKDGAACQDEHQRKQ